MANVRCLGIASPQRSASEAGAASFEAGGNAFDAALAAATSLAVSYPDNCALGGDLIALIRRPGHEPLVVNASGWAAAGTDVDALRSGAAMPVYGPATVTVPGLVAGLHAIWAFGAARPWHAAFEMAIQQARDGTEVSPSLAASIEANAQRIEADTGLRGVLGTASGLLAAGSTLRQPALASSLEAIAAHGPAAFYDGPIGASLIATLRAHGSALSAGDFAEFSPELVAPLRTRLPEGELLTAPPNSQGFLLPLILQAVGQLDERLDPLGPDAARLAAIFRHAVSVRSQYLADPARVPVPVAELLDPERLRVVPAEPTRPASGDTVAVVAADDEGNAVSLIQSLFHSFGAGILDPRTGIICHNRGSYFSLDPRSPNVIAPGKRPAHTLMPATVERQGKPAVVAGTMGGSGQPQILSQVLLRLRHGDDPTAAVSAPRWVYGGMEVDSPPDEVLIESRVPDEAVRALRAEGFACRMLGDYDENVGHAQLVKIEQDGSITAASDPRSEGAGLVRRVP
jgi:gamma-glutamyltranspeptidase/glutathione hydrolase